MRVVRIALPIGILALGIVAFVVLGNSKPEAKESPRDERATVVEVIEVQPSNEALTIVARGSVIPARQVALGPEVGGKVVQVAEGLVPGGRFAEGSLLVRVDPSQYRLALAQHSAAVDSARTQLEIEEGRKKIAEREWELFEKGRPEEERASLALREPQLRTAKVNLEAAESGLRRARLDVGRTVVEAPFNGVVQARNVDLGQMVAPGSQVLSFVGTDHYWVQVSVPLEQLGWLDVPGVGGVTEGARAVVRQQIGDEVIQREGRVVRLLSDVDPAGRMARLLVEIEDPLGVHRAPEEAPDDGPRLSQLPLLLGAYVEVEIQGRGAREVIEIPRVALREGATVYLMGPDDSLNVRPIGEHVLWRRRDTVLVGGGLAAGDRVIVSPVAAPIEGMKLRLPGGVGPAGDEPAPEPAGEGADRAAAEAPAATAGKPAGARDSAEAPAATAGKPAGARDSAEGHE